MESPFQLAFSTFLTSSRGVLFPWGNKKEVLAISFLGKINGGKTSKASENVQHFRLELQCDNFLCGKSLFEFSEYIHESYYRKWGRRGTNYEEAIETNGFEGFLKPHFSVMFPCLSFPVGNVLVVSMERIVVDVKLFNYFKKQHQTT